MIYLSRDGVMTALCKRNNRSETLLVGHYAPRCGAFVGGFPSGEFMCFLRNSFKR
jgi:hypothetical protein